MARKPMPLTPRERVVLAEIATGKSTQEVAKHLGRAHDTIKTQLSRILKKMDAKNRTHMVALAVQQGLLDLHGDGGVPHHQVHRWFIEVEGRDSIWRVVNPNAGGYPDLESAKEARSEMWDRNPAMWFRIVKMRAYYFLHEGDEAA